jgi:hypothetical protein
MELEITNNGNAIIKTDYRATEDFSLLQPALIERTGQIEDGRGVYTLTYLVKERTGWNTAS